MLDTLVLCMEYCKKSLLSLKEPGEGKNALNSKRVKRAIAQVFCALDFIHQRGYYHGGECSGSFTAFPCKAANAN